MIPTDWLLIRRLGAELERALQGARVTDAGMLDDGRIALVFSGRAAGPRTLAIDPFGSPPIVTLEDGPLSLAADPGWLRQAGATLRGMRLDGIRARRGDRVLALAFGTSSRFGVRTEIRVVLELVPRFGNVIVLRDNSVTAAAKQFSPADNETRAVQLGLPYEPPPLPPPEHVLPRLLAEAAAGDPAALLARLEPAAADPEAPLHVYRERDGTLAAIHLAQLPQFADREHAVAASLLPLLAEARAQTARSRGDDATERRRAALTARIARRARAARDERAGVVTREGDAAARDRLRRAGDALYTHALEVPPGATSFVPPTDPDLTIALDPDADAKANARAYHARYRKASDALPHLQRRREALDARTEALEHLAFEAERADAPTLAELERALDEIEGAGRKRAGPAAPRIPAGRLRPPLRIDRPSGARIFVGRSPRENVEVTFRLARPDDLWFHARGIPGSHVVLQAPPGGVPEDADLDAAADLAAAHSRARHSGRVEIDFTERKHVRKQRDGGPGMVWYTHARTRVGVPERAPA